jgi:hypothetical protein
MQNESELSKLAGGVNESRLPMHQEAYCDLRPLSATRFTGTQISPSSSRAGDSRGRVKREMNDFSSIWGDLSFRPLLFWLPIEPCPLDGCPSRTLAYVG